MSEVATDEVKVGIVELQEVVALALEVLDSGHLIMADGKIGFGDIADLWTIFQRVGPAFHNIDRIPAELSDLSLEEVDTLVDTISIGYDLGPDSSKLVLIKVLKIIRSVYEVFLLIRG